MTKAPAITDANFESTLQDHSLVLVDFWATWCPPCQKLGPIIDELANDYAGRIMIGKLDVDKNPGVTTKYGIKSIPALLVFKEGKLLEQIMGANTKAALQQKLDTYI